MSIGPRSLASQQLHASKYRQRSETFDDYCIRYARTTADDETHFRKLLYNLRTQASLPGGRQQRAVGWPFQTTAFNCLASETPILTLEYGEIPIADVAGETVHVCDGNGEWVEAPVACFGEQELYSVRLTRMGRSLTIRATGEHGWMVCGRRRITYSLNSSDYIDFLSPKPADESDDYRKGIAHGLIYGDGSATGGGYSLRLCGEKKELLPLLSEYPLSYPPSANGDPFCYFYGENVWCDLKALPPISSGPSYLLGFMRGWLATDGCVSLQPDVTLCTGPEQEVWVKRVGPIVGFNVVGSSAMSDSTNYGLRNKVVRNIRLDRRFLEDADFLRSKHQDRFKKDKYKEGWKVASVTGPTCMEPVYCATVPTTGSFLLTAGIHSGNCFVGGTIPDDTAGIGHSVTEAMLTLRSGGGCGWDFSPLRPAGEPIRGLGDDAYSSGPVSFMGIWHAMCSTIRSAGERRGAMMGVLDVRHPDIMQFIRAKADQRSLTNFNISVGTNQEFMEAVKADGLYNLRFPVEGPDSRVFRSVRALDVWSILMENNWDWAEPGILFLDIINRMNPLRYIEYIAATNPCAEQPLPPNGACLLLSHNLVKYLVPSYRDPSRSTPSNPHGSSYVLDLDRFAHDVEVSVRACDNVFDNTVFPLPAQKAEAFAKRRMGIGVTGVANALEVCGLPYGSPGYLAWQDQILTVLRDTAYHTSIDMARTKGSFPLFDADKWLASGFALTLPDDIRHGIRTHGLRNGLLLSIAPTGTISLTADNVSSGIEPPYSLEVDRIIQTCDGPQTVSLNDYALEEYGVRCRTAMECSPADHIGVLCAAQHFVDSSISKTTNVRGAKSTPASDPSEMTFTEFKELYMMAYDGGAKGCSTFNVNGRRAGIITERISKDAGRDDATRETHYSGDHRSNGVSSTPQKGEGACYVDPATGTKECG